MSTINNNVKCLDDELFENYKSCILNLEDILMTQLSKYLDCDIQNEINKAIINNHFSYISKYDKIKEFFIKSCELISPKEIEIINNTASDIYSCYYHSELLCNNVSGFNNYYLMALRLVYTIIDISFTDPFRAKIIENSNLLKILPIRKIIDECACYYNDIAYGKYISKDLINDGKFHYTVKIVIYDRSSDLNLHSNNSLEFNVRIKTIDLNDKEDIINIFYNNCKPITSLKSNVYDDIIGIVINIPKIYTAPNREEIINLRDCFI